LGECLRLSLPAPADSNRGGGNRRRHGRRVCGCIYFYDHMPKAKAPTKAGAKSARRLSIQVGDMQIPPRTLQVHSVFAADLGEIPQRRHVDFSYLRRQNSAVTSCSDCPMVVGLEGRPLTRDEERRMTAQVTERQPGSQSLATASRYTILNSIAEFMTLNPMVEFAFLFVLGMLLGVSAVFIFSL
jgi:hypothetical protein